MHIDLFSSIRTIDDMKNRLGVLQEVSNERCVSFDSLLSVQGTNFNDLTYSLSATKNGFITSHYFTYRDKDTKCVGMCEMPVATKKLVPLSKPIYNQLITIHPLLWLGVDTNGLYDVIFKDKVILSNVLDYDLLDMGGCIQFLQLDCEDGTSLVCLDMWNNKSGVVPIATEEQFKEWFEFVVAKRGYEGKLDHLSISGLFQIYFEVINTIFNVSKFKPI